MIDTKVRKLLIGGSEEDLKVATALIARKGLVKEGIYAFEDVEKWEKTMRLEKVRALQTKYPQGIISGSIALFLHGCRCNRWENTSDPFDSGTYNPDIDLILPYYELLIMDKLEKQEQGYTSGNDFEDLYVWDNTVNIDVRIDPQQKYELIKYNGFEYKVSNVFDIISAKIKYSKQNGGGKHTRDLHDIIGKTTFGEYLKKANSSQTEMTI